MNYSNPILICDENEEFRILIREMLTRNGFFHILEATSGQEAEEILKKKKDYFILIDAKEVTSPLTEILHQKKQYLIFADSGESDTLALAARLGVNHIVSYPLHSQKLMDKILSFL